MADNSSSIIFKSAGSDNIPRASEPMGIFIISGVIVLVASIAALGGVIYYKKSLNDGVEAKRADLKRIEADFSQSPINEWARMAESIDIAKDVLSKHQHLTNAFDFLEKNTIPQVRFSRFEYDASLNTAKINAEAQNYTILAQQKDIFEKDPVISKLGMSNFLLTPTGGVKFTIDLTFSNSELTR